MFLSEEKNQNKLLTHIEKFSVILRHFSNGGCRMNNFFLKFHIYIFIWLYIYEISERYIWLFPKCKCMCMSVWLSFWWSKRLLIFTVYVLHGGSEGWDICPWFLFHAFCAEILWETEHILLSFTIAISSFFFPSCMYLSCNFQLTSPKSFLF